MCSAWWLLVGLAMAGVEAEGNFIPRETSLLDRGFSLVGIALLVGVAWLISEKRWEVKWRPVFWGVALQLTFGAIVLSPFLSDFFYTVVDGAVNQMLDWSGEGATFLFASMEPHLITLPDGSEQGFVGQISPPVKTFAFWVLPTIIFFSAVMSVLYHLGVMQQLVKVIAWIMIRTMGTSGSESLSAAGNIFVGQTEAPLLVRPFVDKMTRSELMAIMTGGFATVSGGVMGAYVKFLQGVPNIAGHLVMASIISAPAALAIAKVIVPETEESFTAGKIKMKLEKAAGNVMEAAANGSTDGMKLALNVGAMLIAFVGMVAMFNWLTAWVPVTFCADGGVDLGYACTAATAPVGADLHPTILGAVRLFGPDQVHGLLGEVSGLSVAGLDLEGARLVLAGESLSLSRIFGWAFAPIAFIMGVPWSESMVVGRLLGEKIMLTEFIAYMNLGNLIHAEEAVMSQRSAIIASYALCGFANFASIGIQLGGIGGIAPRRMRDLASLGIRAMFAGVIAACMTGAVAGIFL